MFLWENGVVTDLPLLPGAVVGGANGINDSGQIVGTYWTDGRARRRLSSEPAAGGRAGRRAGVVAQGGPTRVRLGPSRPDRDGQRGRHATPPCYPVAWKLAADAVCVVGRWNENPVHGYRRRAPCFRSLDDEPGRDGRETGEDRSALGAGVLLFVEAGQSGDSPVRGELDEVDPAE